MLECSTAGIFVLCLILFSYFSKMKLPNHENAVISIEKLRDYCLNFEHPRGKHKALVFKSALDLEKKDSDLLKMIIFEALKTNDAVETFSDIYGIRYTVDIPYSIKDKQAVIRTIWITKTNENFPRLTTCYIKE
jgi:hypothetical protein